MLPTAEQDVVNRRDRDKQTRKVGWDSGYMNQSGLLLNQFDTEPGYSVVNPTDVGSFLLKVIASLR